MRKYHIIPKVGSKFLKNAKLYRDCFYFYICFYLNCIEISIFIHRHQHFLHSLCTFECLLCFYMFINRLQNYIIIIYVYIETALKWPMVTWCRPMIHEIVWFFVRKILRDFQRNDRTVTLSYYKNGNCRIFLSYLL